jgi:hypothetical protein
MVGERLVGVDRSGSAVHGNVDKGVSTLDSIEFTPRTLATEEARLAISGPVSHCRLTDPASDWTVN